MKNHAICYRFKENRFQTGIFVCGHLGTNKSTRLVFANDPTDKDGSEKDEKKITKVTSANAHEALLELTKTGKITDSQRAKAFKVLSTGSESDKQKLIALIQNGIDGNISSIELDKLLKDAEDKPKEADTETHVSDVKSKIHDQTEGAIKQSSGISESLAYSKNPKERELAGKMGGIRSDLHIINNKLKDTGVPAKNKLDELIDDKKISSEHAQKLHEIDFLEESAQEKWNKIIGEIKDPKVKTELEKVLELKKEQADKERKLGEEFKQKMREMREASNAVGKIVMENADEGSSIEKLKLASGLSLHKGQVLTYPGLKSTEGRTSVHATTETATIKDIKFEEFQIENEKGEIEKFKSPIPTVIVESKNPTTGLLGEDRMGLPQFLAWVGAMDVVEELKNKAELEKSIGHELHEKDKFEFHELIAAETGTYSSKDELVTVERIDEVTGKIYLDKPVKLGLDSDAKDTVLTFGQFSKWFKRNEAVKPIANINKLREDLRAFNIAQNTYYQDRDPAHYPPIEVKLNEVLKFDDNSNKTFVIKKVSDKEIKLNNGRTFTPASFLRWVKKNEVEKKDPHAEAEKATHLMKDGDEKKTLKDEIKTNTAYENELDVEDTERGSDHEEGEHPPVHAEEPAGHSVSKLRKFWASTRVLSLSDFWEMGKISVELVQRKWKRWGKEKIGVVGERMFGFWTELGAEYKSTAKHAENEEVNHHVENYKTMGVDFLKHELHAAGTKDIMKAAITALAEKGDMRWDDPLFWARVNYFKNIYGPHYDKEGKFIDPVNQKNHMNNLELILDGWWGPDNFRELRQKQDSSYNSIREGFKDNAARLENDPEGNGGLKFQLKRLLWKHSQGQYVKPAEYEAYLRFAISAGKLTYQDKLYYLIMGIGTPAKGSHGPGQTLLHIDRAGALDGELLRAFPMLDYFTSPETPHFDEEGKPIWVKGKTEDGDKVDNKGYKLDDDGNRIQKIGRPNINNYKLWIKKYCLPDIPGGSLDNVTDIGKEIGPNKSFNAFMERDMVWDEYARIRIDKVADPTQWDHDDMHFLAPMLKTETVESIVKQANGARANISMLGMRNAIAGFNNLALVKMKMLQETIDKEKKSTDKKVIKNAQKDSIKHVRDFINVLESFIRVDAILDRRFHHGREMYTRFGRQEWDSKPLVDASRPVGEHADEMRLLLRKLGEELGLKTEADLIFADYGISPDARDAEAQQRAVSTYVAKLEGKMQEKKFTPEKILELYNKVEEEAKKEHKEIKGIPEYSKIKVTPKTDEQAMALKAYEEPQRRADFKPIKERNEDEF